MVPRKGVSRARSGSTWMKLWSPVTSANWLTRSCVMVCQLVGPTFRPTCSGASAMVVTHAGYELSLAMDPPSGLLISGDLKHSARSRPGEAQSSPSAVATSGAGQPRARPLGRGGGLAEPAAQVLDRHLHHLQEGGPFRLGEPLHHRRFEVGHRGLAGGDDP